jgi:hypothetical protein
MHVITGGVAALAVATIFYIYRGYLGVLLHRQRQLRERVAYMLWVMATHRESGDDAPRAGRAAGRRRKLRGPEFQTGI